MVNLHDLIKRAYPTAVFGGSVLLVQEANQPVTIAYWDATVLGPQPTLSELMAAPDATTREQRKAIALANATALGFSRDQLRLISALALLVTGTPAQKAKAAVLLAPIIKLVGDARSIAAQIDADQVPATLYPAIIPTDDP